MSTTLMLLEHTSQIVPMAGDGVLDFLDTKISEAGTVLKGFSVVAGIGFVVFQAIVSRGAMARIIMSGLAAGIFVWIVWNVTTVKDRVDNEVNSAPPVGQLHFLDHDASTSGTAQGPGVPHGLAHRAVARL